MKRGRLLGMLVLTSMTLFIVTSLRAWPPPIGEQFYRYTDARCVATNCQVLISEWDHQLCTVGDVRKCQFTNDMPVVVCVRDLQSPECIVRLVGYPPTAELNPECEGQCVSSGQSCPFKLFKCRL